MRNWEKQRAQVIHCISGKDVLKLVRQIDQYAAAHLTREKARRETAGRDGAAVFQTADSHGPPRIKTRRDGY